MRSHSLDDDDYSVYQNSTMAALLAGVYDGDVSVDELLRHGNFGLGTFNHLDGEMVVLDGVCYNLRVDATVTLTTGGENIPFAAITQFHPDITIPITTPMMLSSLNSEIDSVAASENIPLALRVDGLFDEIRARTVDMQTAPDSSFDEASRYHAPTTLVNTHGTIVGFRTPRYEEAVAVAGYHLHYIDDDRKRGGHVLDLTITSGTVSLCAITDLYLSLPDTEQFRGDFNVRLERIASDDDERSQ